MRVVIVAVLGLLAGAPGALCAQVREEPVRIAVGPDTLAGTLALPTTAGPHPAVVLLSGMLRDTRDASSGSFRTFKVLSDTLAALGMAVLRYDDRGVGESGGRDTWQYTLNEHADEAIAALAWLRARPDIDGRRVGLLGHSYGGPMVARAAHRGAALAFVILASPHVAIDRDIVIGMARRQQIARGRSSVEAEEEAAFLLSNYGAASRGEGDWAQVRRAMESRARPAYDQLPDSVRRTRPFEAYFNGTLYATLLQLGPTPMWRDFWELDLTADYRALRAPVLALFGERDNQVVADENVPLLRDALAAGANPPFAVSIVPQANHYLRAARTPAGQFAAGTVDTVAGWLRIRGLIR